MARKRSEIESKRQAWAMALKPVVAEITAAGTTSKTGIAKELNRRSLLTLRGASWTNVQISKLLDRINSVALS